MSSSSDGWSASAVACPVCKSQKTVRTSERFGEHLFFCADCEHSWAVETQVAHPKDHKKI